MVDDSSEIDDFYLSATIIEEGYFNYDLFHSNL